MEPAPLAANAAEFGVNPNWSELSGASGADFEYVRARVCVCVHKSSSKRYYRNENKFISCLYAYMKAAQYRNMGHMLETATKQSDCMYY